jgi:hypothetical protein
VLRHGTYNLFNLSRPRTAKEETRYAAQVAVVRGLNFQSLAVQEVLGPTREDTGSLLRQFADDTGLRCMTAPNPVSGAPAPRVTLTCRSARRTARNVYDESVPAWVADRQAAGSRPAESGQSFAVDSDLPPSQPKCHWHPPSCSQLTIGNSQDVPRQVAFLVA